MNWTIRDILASRYLTAKFFGNKNVLTQNIHSVIIDSRKIEAGSLFVAIEGERYDGHDFLDDVFAKGALAAIVSRDWWTNKRSESEDRAFVVVEDTLNTLQKMARNYKRRIAPKVIALTGSNGKTTTKEMIANVLDAAYKVHKTEGNLNNHIGVPLTLLAMQPGIEVAVVEMGTNHFGEIKKLCEIAEPEFGLITNIGRAHTEFLQDIDGVRRAKGEIFEAIAETGTACVYIDDPNVVQAARDAKIRKEVTYGFSAEAEIRGENLHLGDDGCARFEFSGKIFSIGVPGMHNAGNALAAIALAQLLKIDLDSTHQALARPVAVSGRMRRLEIGGRIVIDDAYNANPESTRAALDFLHTLPGSGARFAVLGDMLELGEQAVADHCSVLEYGLAYKNIAQILLHGTLMQQAFKKIKNRSNKIRLFKEKSKIAEYLFEASTIGDVVLVKGSRGAKMEEVLSDFEKLAGD